ncbi:extracellular solute-binding protein [Paenibacillus sp. 1P07SE]|uniref:extracellular solute-binding protein n=1 Tax=Paenibacillus sp. 1P07SE TaxID=3132209 RepID=UPI0039A5A455
MKLKQLMWIATLSLIALMAAGCTDNAESGTVTDGGQTNSSGTHNSNGVESASKATPAGELPIVAEKTKIQVLMLGNPNVEDYKTNEYSKWLEEQTNIEVEWEVAQPSDGEQILNLALASGDYPDVILNFGVSPSKMMVYGGQGVFLPLNDLIDTYGYGAKQMYESVPGSEEVITAPDGNIYGLPRVDMNPHSMTPQRMWIYTPWLEKLGLEMPETTEEFYEVLKAFKTQDPNGNGIADEVPLAASTNGWFAQIDDFLMNAFILNEKGNDNNYLLINDGVLDVNFNKPEWKEGLLYLHRLYSEGLLMPESFTQDNTQLKRLAENPDVPILGAFPKGVVTEVVMLNGDRWSDYKTVPPLTGPDGLKITPYKPFPIHQGQFIVTSACEDPAVCYRWGDMMMTEEFTMRGINGRPGEEWREAEPGELGLNGEQGTWMKLQVYPGVQNVYWANQGPMVQPAPMRAGLVVNKGELAQVLFEEATTKYFPHASAEDQVVPPLTFNEEQAVEIADLQQTITDYVVETMTRAITGDIDIEKEWDSYLQQLENLNIERFVELKQEAYDLKYKS